MRKGSWITAALAAGAIASAGDATAKKGEPGTTVTVYSPSAVPSQAAYPQYGGYRPQYYQPQPYGYQQPYPVADAGGYAVVTERRKINVGAGSTEVRFGDVPAQIDPTTVHFIDETDASTVVSQQRFEHDLATVDTLLARYVGK